MKCNRCDFRAEEPGELEEHAAETGHPLCLLCSRSLRDEPRVCVRCVSRTRDAIELLQRTDLEPVVTQAGSVSSLALVLVAGGNTEALKPYKPDPERSRPVSTCYPPIAGSETEIVWWERNRFGARDPRVMVQSTAHPAYVDDRPVADGKEHYRDHWQSDPLIPSAEIEQIARSWRLWLGEPPSDELWTLTGGCDWLLKRLTRAADGYPFFDDDAPLLWALAAEVQAVAGESESPMEAPAKCFDCAGKLVSRYRDPIVWHFRALVEKIQAQRKAERTYRLPLTPYRFTRPGHADEGVEMVETDDDTPFPIWTCRDCRRVYEPAEYWLALKAFLETQAEQAG